MDIIAVIIIALGIAVVGDAKVNDGVHAKAASEWLNKEIGDDLLGFDKPGQKYRWGNQTVDEFGNLKTQ